MIGSLLRCEALQIIEVHQLTIVPFALIAQDRPSTDSTRFTFQQFGLPSTLFYPEEATSNHRVSP